MKKFSTLFLVGLFTLGFVAGCDDDFLEDLEEIVIVAPGSYTYDPYVYDVYEEVYYYEEVVYCGWRDPWCKGVERK